MHLHRSYTCRQQVLDQTLLVKGSRSLPEGHFCKFSRGLSPWLIIIEIFRRGGYCFDVVSPSEAFPSITLFCPDAYLGNGFQILLSFYRNMYLHMRTAHTRFGCTAPAGNRVCYFQIYIVIRTHIFRLYYSLRKILRGILFWRYLSVLPLSIWLWTTESWPKAHCEVTRLLPLTKWESCQLLAKIWGKHLLWHPGRSLKDGLPLKWHKVLIMALNPIQAKINRLQTVKTYENYIFYSSYFGVGYEFSLNLLLLNFIVKIPNLLFDKNNEW